MDSWDDILETHQPHGQEVTGGREVDVNQGNNVEMNVVMNHQQDVGNSSRSNRRRKKRSKVWEEMTKFTGADGRDWARCNYCKKKFDGSSKLGTSHLKNHLDRCPRKRNNGGDDQSTNLTPPVVIAKKSVIDLIKSCFDDRGCPTVFFDVSVLNSRKAEILQVYEEEKKKLRTVFGELSCRFNLIINKFNGWYILRVCYIDNNWEPKMKIISFDDVVEDGELHHNYQNLVKILRESCLDLKIDGNVCSISYHSFGDPDFDLFVQSDYEDVIGEIKSWFSQRDNSLPFLGFLFSPDAVSLIRYNFENNLKKWLWNTFDGIRKCIDYVNSTPSNMHNFQIAVDNAKSMGKKVNISSSFPKYVYADSLWNFGRAVGYKEALCELERIDSEFNSRSINLTKEHWDEAAAICQRCKELEASERQFRARKYTYTTANQYFPKFCDLYMKIRTLQRTQLDEETSTAIEKLASALEKYKLVFVITVVLDPRFKIDIVQLWYHKIYGCDAGRNLEKIMNDFTNVYNEYAKVSQSESRDATTSYVDAMGRPCTSSHNILVSNKSSELARYLSEPKFSLIEKFDILAWWRVYTSIFPTLARMARDFLALPIHDHQFYLFMNRTLEIANCIMDSDEGLDDDIKPALMFLTQRLDENETINISK